MKPNLDMASRDLGDVHNHGEEIDPVRKRVKCTYCEKEISGFHRLKCHLAHITGDVVRCESVPDVVKESMKKNLDDKKKKKRNLGIKQKTSNSRSRKRKSTPCSKTRKSSEADPLERDETSNQEIYPEVGINGVDDSSENEAKKTLGRLFYLHGYDPDDVESPFLRNWALYYVNNESIKCIPSSEELHGWIFHEAILSTQKYVDGMRKMWERTGCTILLDGWINSKNQTLVNILVYCPKGTVYLKSHDISTHIGNDGGMKLFLDEVIQDVGVSNVVQIITYASTSSMKSMGSQVMKKYKNMFWVISASHCIEQMLETFKKIPPIQGALEKARIIEEFDKTLTKSSKMMSIEPYFSLENIFSKKDMLINMFASRHDMTTSSGGIKVSEVVRKKVFWVGADMALKASLPLLRTLQEIHERNEPQTGRLFELFRETRRNIRKEFKNQLKRFVEIIDEIGGNHLFSPIHFVGDFLNPFLPYLSKPNTEEVIVNTARNHKAREFVRAQVRKYSMEKESSRITVENHAMQLSPAEWWLNHGGEYPELQSFAIRILSQTCDGAEKFKLRRELVDKLFSGEKHDDRNNLEDYVYLQYNLKLQEFDSGVGRSIIVKKHSWFGF